MEWYIVATSPVVWRNEVSVSDAVVTVSSVCPSVVGANLLSRIIRAFLLLQAMKKRVTIIIVVHAAMQTINSTVREFLIIMLLPARKYVGHSSMMT